MEKRFLLKKNYRYLGWVYCVVFIIAAVAFAIRFYEMAVGTRPPDMFFLCHAAMHFLIMPIVLPAVFFPATTGVFPKFIKGYFPDGWLDHWLRGLKKYDLLENTR
jgi:hypothetical protein